MPFSTHIAPGYSNESTGPSRMRSIIAIFYGRGMHYNITLPTITFKEKFEIDLGAIR